MLTAIEPQLLKQLIARNTPVLYLHPYDSYMPCSVDYFMQNSELCAAESQEAPPVVLAGRGTVTPPLLLKLQHDSKLPHKWLALDPAARCGAPKDALEHVPLYVHAKEVHLPDGSLEALELTFLTFYAYNGPYALLGCQFMPKVGAHDGDWERLTVRLGAPDFGLQGVWYNAHRPRDGTWVPAEKVELEAGRPVAYVAKHGHGTYPKAGVVLRAAFFANDLCSRQGPVWRPHTCMLLPAVVTESSGGGISCVTSRGSRLPLGRANQQYTYANADMVTVKDDDGAWLHFAGNWGTTPGPAHQGWWLMAECPVSRAPWLRIVGHIWPEADQA